MYTHNNMLYVSIYVYIYVYILFIHAQNLDIRIKVAIIVLENTLKARYTMELVVQ